MKNMVKVCKMVMGMMIEKYNVEWYDIIDGQYKEEFKKTVSKVSGVKNLRENEEFVQWFNELVDEL